ncbi:hypothetical protein E2320_012377, partial [Naja naja]
AVKNMVGM